MKMGESIFLPISATISILLFDPSAKILLPRFMISVDDGDGC